jgi:hypothetical protein
MWLKLSNQWVNMSHIVRVEFKVEGNTKVATFYSTKTGGQDRTFVQGPDADLVEKWLNDQIVPPVEIKAVKTKTKGFFSSVKK